MPDMPTQHLTWDHVRRAALRAFYAGTLGAQYGHPVCLYTYGDGCHCPIGAGLNNEVLAYMRQNKSYNHYRLSKLREEGLVTYSDRKIETLQWLHDEWLLNPTEARKITFWKFLRDN